ncbi:SUMF1/EgtB/PvdO family nonheme iron enzyme [Neolewinella litorea]|nr:SUMF1/EgtB/PvdO family nonheme iron enzyme [Neolewinella litorea]
MLISCSALMGNNILIENLRVEYEVGNPDYALLTFDLSWENAWRTTSAPANWDAAWVFAKYRPAPDGEWQHLILSNVGQTPNGAAIEVMEGTGAMVYAAAPMTGPATYSQVQLRWSLTANGIDLIEIMDFRIFGVEMVYVPGGSFYLGSTFKGQEINKLYEGGHPNKKDPYPVTSSDAIPVANASHSLYYDDVYGNGADVAGPIPAAFPKGFRAFYAMKYELSQQQYVDFFNTLTPAQKAVHDITDATGKNTDGDQARNCVSYDPLTGEDAVTTAPHVPVGYVSVRDMLAYLDWSGLRPMTEMEFEKLCRGPVFPVDAEFAWGTDQVARWKFLPSLPNAPNEILTNLNKLNANEGYAAYDMTTPNTRFGLGPLRSGIFSGSLDLGTTRVWSGAGYYGNMELSGNQAEGVISITHADGRAFTNQHGNGFLPETGYADVPTWPQTYNGIGIKGGHGNSIVDDLQVADRAHMTNALSSENFRPYWLQFRGVRGL